jgi:hypothetical protein
MVPALQYGGFQGKFGLISLQKFWAGNLALVESQLKIQCNLAKAKVIARDNAGNENPVEDKTIKAAAKHFGDFTNGPINTADPRFDSPPIEIRADYITNAPADYPAVQVNVGEYMSAYDTAFGPSGSTDQQVAWLVKFHAPITAQQAAAYLGQ